MSCSSKRKWKIVVSTAEVETIAVCEAPKEVVFVEILLLDTYIKPERCVEKIKNQGALTIENNQGSHGRRKPIDIKNL